MLKFSSFAHCYQSVYDLVPNLRNSQFQCTTNFLNFSMEFALFQVLIPNFRHPHFNFVGKILGPKGATLQAMAKQFKCHIYVLGRGSTKDRAKVSGFGDNLALIS